MCTVDRIGSVDSALVFARAKQAIRDGHKPDEATMILIMRWLEKADLARQCLEAQRAQSAATNTSDQRTVSSSFREVEEVDHAAAWWKINITAGTFARVCARNRQHIYDLLLRAFKRSGLSQAEVARRAGMAPEVVSRIFKRPRNVEIDAASRLLFTMTGATMTLAEEYPRAAVC